MSIVIVIGAVLVLSNAAGTLLMCVVNLLGQDFSWPIAV